jgi:hypothetical protein
MSLARAQGRMRRRPRARAMRISGAAPRVDGVLDDEAGARPRVRLVRRFPRAPIHPAGSAYDDAALFVAARLPSGSAQFASLTGTGGCDTETFTVSLDTYLDRRTTPASPSRRAACAAMYHSQDGQRRNAVHPIWARARVDATSWTAEMRIPFSQRTSMPPEQTWGCS